MSDRQSTGQEETGMDEILSTVEAFAVVRNQGGKEESHRALERQECQMN